MSLLLRASLARVLQGFQLRLLQELCQMPVLEMASYGEPVKSRSYFLLAQEKPKNELRAAPCCGFTSSSAKEPFY